MDDAVPYRWSCGCGLGWSVRVVEGRGGEGEGRGGEGLEEAAGAQGRAGLQQNGMGKSVLKLHAKLTCLFFMSFEIRHSFTLCKNFISPMTFGPFGSSASQKPRDKMSGGAPGEGQRETPNVCT